MREKTECREWEMEEWESEIIFRKREELKETGEGRGMQRDGLVLLIVLLIGYWCFNLKSSFLFLSAVDFSMNSSCNVPQDWLFPFCEEKVKVSLFTFILNKLICNLY